MTSNLYINSSVLYKNSLCMRGNHTHTFYFGVSRCALAFLFKYAFTIKVINMIYTILL